MSVTNLKSHSHIDKLSHTLVWMFARWQPTKTQTVKGRTPLLPHTQVHTDADYHAEKGRQNSHNALHVYMHRSHTSACLSPFVLWNHWNKHFAALEKRRSRGLVALHETRRTWILSQTHMLTYLLMTFHRLTDFTVVCANGRIIRL